MPKTLFSPSKGQLKPAKFLTTKNCLSSWSNVTDAKFKSLTLTKNKNQTPTHAGNSHADVLREFRCATQRSDDVTRLAPIDWY